MVTAQMSPEELLKRKTLEQMVDLLSLDEGLEFRLQVKEAV